jgi:hypothetical protein
LLQKPQFPQTWWGQWVLRHEPSTMPNSRLRQVMPVQTLDLSICQDSELWRVLIQWVSIAGCVSTFSTGQMGRSRRGLKVFRCPEPQRETWLRVASDLVRRMSAEVETWSVKGTTGSHIIHILSLEALDFACKQLPGKKTWRKTCSCNLWISLVWIHLHVSFQKPLRPVGLVCHLARGGPFSGCAWQWLTEKNWHSI